MYVSICGREHCIDEGSSLSDSLIFVLVIWLPCVVAGYYSCPTGRIRRFNLQGLASLASLAFGGQAAETDRQTYIYQGIS